MKVRHYIKVSRTTVLSGGFGIELLALSDEARMLTLTPGKDYFVLVLRWLTLGQTELIHTKCFTDLFIKL